MSKMPLRSVVSYNFKARVNTSLMENMFKTAEGTLNHSAPKIAEENERYHKEGEEKNRNAEQNGIY